MAVREIDAGMTEVLRERLLNDGETFDGTGYDVAIELLQVNGATWAPVTAYEVGDIVRPSHLPTGRLYRCIAEGQSDAANEPQWPVTHGAQVEDATVTWLDITPTAAWYMSALGEVAVTEYDRLPPDTSYRVRYVVTDNQDHTGPFPNLNRYNVWRVGAVMAG
jgi:hypothetical protein